MSFHTPSFLMGCGVAVVLVTTRRRLRPVAVELGALGVHLARLGHALFERQIEHVEDLWAEVEERVRTRDRGGKMARRDAARTSSPGVDA